MLWPSVPKTVHHTPVRRANQMLRLTFDIDTAVVTNIVLHFLAKDSFCSHDQPECSYPVLVLNGMIVKGDTYSVHGIFCLTHRVGPMVVEHTQLPEGD